MDLSLSTHYFLTTMPTGKFIHRETCNFQFPSFTPHCCFSSNFPNWENLGSISCHITSYISFKIQINAVFSKHTQFLLKFYHLLITADITLQCRKRRHSWSSLVKLIKWYYQITREIFPVINLQIVLIYEYKAEDIRENFYI